MSYYNSAPVEELIGKTIKEIQGGSYLDQLIFTLEDGTQYKMYHSQDCCESVFIEDIVGDLKDLEGSPILVATENSNYDGPQKNDYDDAYQWTFYEFATIKGSVTIRWYGSSNGYYSTSVDFVKI